MNETLGKRIARLRKDKDLRQNDLAQLLGVSPQAVSKWETDLTCPDISLLPKLGALLGVTTDELLSGESREAAVRLMPPEKRKNMDELMLRIKVHSADGDKVRINLPMSLLRVAMDSGMEIPSISGNEALQSIDLNQITALVEKGLIGDLLEIESANGDIVNIFVE